LKGEIKMFKKFTKKDRRNSLEKEIDSVIDGLKDMEPSSEEYSKAVENLERLCKVKGPKKERLHVSPDTIALGVFGIIQMAMVLKHEKFDVITSKAFNYVWKGKP
jgi:hypothetical protein